MSSSGGRTDLRPAEGARFLLERVEHSATRATYRCVIATPDAEYPVTATLADDGGVTLDASPAPDKLREMLEMLAKLTARGAAKRRDDGLVVWPARILRWRGPGR